MFDTYKSDGCVGCCQIGRGEAAKETGVREASVAGQFAHNSVLQVWTMGRNEGDEWGDGSLRGLRSLMGLKGLGGLRIQKGLKDLMGCEISFKRFLKPCQGAKQRALACTIASQKTDELATRKLCLYCLDNRGRAIIAYAQRV